MAKTAAILRVQKITIATHAGVHLWYREPSIIDTFMDSYDFSGKTVVPFATSGMSPIGDSGKNMQVLAPNASFSIRCVREAGYCFGVTAKEKIKT